MRYALPSQSWSVAQQPPWMRPSDWPFPPHCLFSLTCVHTLKQKLAGLRFHLPALLLLPASNPPIIPRMPCVSGGNATSDCRRQSPSSATSCFVATIPDESSRRQRLARRPIICPQTPVSGPLKDASCRPRHHHIRDQPRARCAASHHVTATATKNKNALRDCHSRRLVRMAALLGPIHTQRCWHGVLGRLGCCTHAVSQRAALPRPSLPPQH